VCKRFVSFIDVSAERSANGLLQHVIKTASKFDLRNKLVVQTFDAAAVIAGHTGGLRAQSTRIISEGHTCPLF
jgi:hypothetical protein